MTLAPTERLTEDRLLAELERLPAQQAAAVRVLYVADDPTSSASDLAAAVSFIEHDPRVPELIDAWARGYRTVLELPAEDEAEAWTFIMFRRLLLVAWVGSHQGADIARTLGAAYTDGTCELAERYLSGGF